MKVAVYTLTRDRMAYSQRAFESLESNAGMPFCHFVLDNGSSDGTRNWLKWGYKPHWLKMLPENVGIAVGANMVLDAIFAEGDWDLVVKFDNDCDVVSGKILSRFCDIFADVRRWQNRFALSPRVEGIVNQPKRLAYKCLAGVRVGITGIIGGLFHVVPGHVYKEFRYNAMTPRGGYNDSYFCDWFRKVNGGEVGYVEGLVVRHMDTTDGQTRVYPEYAKRKREEMQEDAAAGKGGQVA